MKLTQIADFKPGRSIQGFYLCKEKHLRHTKNGDIYLDLFLSDSTGTVPGKIWDLVEQYQGRFDSGDPVAVKAKVSEYNDQLQLTINQINLSTEKQYGKYGFSPNLLIQTIDEPIEKLWSDLNAVIEFLDKPFKKLLNAIFKKYRTIIQTIPASINHHHPVRGGFLKHLATTGILAVEAVKHYPELNKDLVLSGILLHDIGKVRSSNDSIDPGHTDEGKLVGHIVLGRDILLEGAAEIKNFPSEILLKLEHIILSHQGSPSKMSVLKPKFPEALLVHYIDEMDGRLNLMLETMQNDPNNEWTDRHNQFKSELYKK